MGRSGCSRAQKTPRRSEGQERTGAKARRTLGNYEDAVVGSHSMNSLPHCSRLCKSLTVHAHAFSASAKEKIEKAGGKAEVVAR